MELFRLFGSIMIDDKEALKSLSDTEKKAKQSKDQLDKLGQGAAKVGKAMAVGFGIAATAATGLIMKFADLTGEIDDNAKKVGMSAEEYQKWLYAAKLSGMEQDEFLGMMKKGQKTFTDANDGVKSAAEAYKKLGINVKEMSSSQAFKAVIKLLAETTDETLRNSIANDIFGKSYADLAPLLKEGADGIENLMKEAEDLGAVMSNEAVESGAKFGDTMDKLGAIVQGVFMALAEELLPVFQDLADWVIDNKDEIIKLAKDAIGFLADALGWVVKNANWLIPVLGTLYASFFALNIIKSINIAIGVFNALLLANPIGLTVTAIAAAVAGIALLISNWDDLYNSIADALGIQKKFDAYQIKEGSTGGGKTWRGFGSATPSRIPQQANGGIVYGETLVNVGEYPGASVNPEVIAPLDKLQSMVGIDYDLLGDVLASKLGRITIALDGKAVGKFVDKRLLTATE